MTDSLELFFSLLTLAASVGSLALAASQVVVRAAPSGAFAGPARFLLAGFGRGSALARA